MGSAWRTLEKEKLNRTKKDRKQAERRMELSGMAFRILEDIARGGNWDFIAD